MSGWWSRSARVSCTPSRPSEVLATTRAEDIALPQSPATAPRAVPDIPHSLYLPAPPPEPTGRTERPGAEPATDARGDTVEAADREVPQSPTGAGLIAQFAVFDDVPQDSGAAQEVATEDLEADEPASPTAPAPGPEPVAPRPPCSRCRWEPGGQTLPNPRCPAPRTRWRLKTSRARAVGTRRCWCWDRPTSTGRGTPWRTNCAAPSSCLRPPSSPWRQAAPRAGTPPPSTGSPCWAPRCSSSTAPYTGLPDALTLPATVGTLVLLTAAAEAGESGSLPRAVAAAAAGGVLFFLFALGVMGLGNAKFAVPLGALLGWHSWTAALLGLVLSYALGAIAAVILLLRGRHRTNTMAFGLYLLIGTLAAGILLSG